MRANVRVFRKVYQVVPLLLLSVTMLTSCSHQYYTASVQQVPLFTEKHQVQISGFAGGGDQTKTNDLQAAVSVSSHIALMGSGMWMRGDKNTTNNSNNYQNQMSGRYGEVAGGYFEKFSGYGVFEVYGGVGSSRQHHNYDSLQTADLRYTKYFVQPVVGLKKEHFEVAFSFRVSYINFTDITTNHIDSGFPQKAGYAFSNLP